MIVSIKVVKCVRQRIFKLVEVADENDRVSNIYDIGMMITIIASLIPLAFKSTNIVFEWLDYITVVIFIIDYILRLITADYKLSGQKAKAFIIYPFTPMAIIDLLSILPSVTMLNSGFKLLKLFRLLRTFRVLRALKFLRYSKSFVIIANVFKKQKRVLSAVATLAVAYVLISALVIFNVEPESFNSFFDAIYWATVSLTTMGYGDIYPVTTIGRIVTMVSSIFGIAIIALPSGIITAGYLDEIKRKD
jgi:voltage-gated potassium channel